MDPGGGLRDSPPCFLRSELMGCFKLESDVVAQERVGTPWGEDDLAGRLRTSVPPLSGLPGALPLAPGAAQGAHGSPALQLWALTVLQLRV